MNKFIIEVANGKQASLLSGRQLGSKADMSQTLASIPSIKLTPQE